MAIWVDADACPNVIKEILFRAAEGTRNTPLTLVANQPLRVPPSLAPCGLSRVLTWRITKSFASARREI